MSVTVMTAHAAAPVWTIQDVLKTCGARLVAVSSREHVSMMMRAQMVAIASTVSAFRSAREVVNVQVPGIVSEAAASKAKSASRI